MVEVGTCYFQGLENKSNGAWACECHILVWMGVFGGKHIGTVTAMIVVSLIILLRMEFRLFKVNIDRVQSSFKYGLKIQLESILSHRRETN